MSRLAPSQMSVGAELAQRSEVPVLAEAQPSAPATEAEELVELGLAQPALPLVETSSAVLLEVTQQALARRPVWCWEPVWVVPALPG